MADYPHLKCPLCGKEAVSKYKPFCSSRCSMIDLGKWLGEGYRIEGPEKDDESASLPKANETEAD